MSNLKLCLEVLILGCDILPVNLGPAACTHTKLGYIAYGIITKPSNDKYSTSDWLLTQIIGVDSAVPYQNYCVCQLGAEIVWFVSHK